MHTVTHTDTWTRAARATQTPRLTPPPLLASSSSSIFLFFVLSAREKRRRRSSDDGEARRDTGVGIGRDGFANGLNLCGGRYKTRAEPKKDDTNGNDDHATKHTPSEARASTEGGHATAAPRRVRSSKEHETRRRAAAGRARRAARGGMKGARRV